MAGPVEFVRVVSEEAQEELGELHRAAALRQGGQILAELHIPPIDEDRLSSSRLQVRRKLHMKNVMDDE